MASFISTRKSVMSLLVLALVSVSNINAASTFAEIDVSKTAGNGNAIKAIAAKLCGANLSADELTRRQGLARTAISDFINPGLINAMKADNAALEKALSCQKSRVRLLNTTCALQASIKKNLQCEKSKYTKKLNGNVQAVNAICKGADDKLFVTVNGVNEPKPPANPPKPCVLKTTPVLTSKFSDVDITKTPGTGDAAKSAAEKVCGATLSEEELKHRAALGNRAQIFINKQMKSAGGNVPLQTALGCQKARNDIMRTTCILQYSTKVNRAFDVQAHTIRQQKIIVLANKVCANVDSKLLVTVPDITIKPKTQGKGKSNVGPASAKHSTADNIPIPSALFLALIIYLLY